MNLANLVLPQYFLQNGKLNILQQYHDTMTVLFKYLKMTCK